VAAVEVEGRGSTLKKGSFSFSTSGVRCLLDGNLKFVKASLIALTIRFELNLSKK